MITDLTLAILHHVLVFGIFAMLAIESSMLRTGLSGNALVRLARIDGGYGMAAAAVIVIGVLRVLYGAKGSAYYLHNAWFWWKMAMFATAGLVSIAPTITFVRWSKAVKSNPAFVPAESQIARTRKLVRLELLLLIIVIACAATMARYAGR